MAIVGRDGFVKLLAGDGIRRTWQFVRLLAGDGVHRLLLFWMNFEEEDERLLWDGTDSYVEKVHMTTFDNGVKRPAIRW